jgi:hypothetical protein
MIEAYCVKLSKKSTPTQHRRGSLADASPEFQRFRTVSFKRLLIPKEYTAASLLTHSQPISFGKNITTQKAAVLDFFVARLLITLLSVDTNAAENL